MHLSLLSVKVKYSQRPSRTENGPSDGSDCLLARPLEAATYHCATVIHSADVNSKGGQVTSQFKSLFEISTMANFSAHSKLDYRVLYFLIPQPSKLANKLSPTDSQVHSSSFCTDVKAPSVTSITLILKRRHHLLKLANVLNTLLFVTHNNHSR